MIAALAAIHTLRRYGENAEAQTALPVLKTVMPAQQYSEFEHFVNDSIACEQKFQAKALPLFERVIPTKENPNEKAGLTYLCGELHRRLGNRDKAKFYYEQCVAIKGHPQWLETWAKEQSDLPPK
jgi:tetratricopeptide (TPR) repeat protein